MSPGPPRGRAAAAALVAAWAGGCFGSREGPDAVVQVEDASREAALAFCVAALRCAPEASRVCEAVGEPPRLAPLLRRQLAEGRIGLDEAATARCLAAYADGTCAEVVAAGACPVLERRTPLGGGCLDDRECTTGRCGGETCPSRCVAAPSPPAPLERLPEGAPCGDPRRPCEAGLACAAPPGTGADAPVCLRPARDGGPCATSDGCAEDHRCVRGACLVPPVADGAPCSADFHCAEGRRCLAGACATPPPPGASCVSGRCGPFARCDAGTCRAVAGPDGPCATEGDCVDGFACLEARCRPVGRVGSACAADADCRSGDCLAGTCTRSEAGGPCRTDRGCAPGAGFCLDGACGFDPPGAPCDPANDRCARGCEPPTPAAPAGACRPPAEAGAPCLDPGACPEGTVCRAASDGAGRACLPSCD